MANKHGRIKITQGIFDAVKICLESGNSVPQTAKFMKISNDVVYMIRDAENLEEYRAMMCAKTKSRKVAAMKAKQEAAQKVAAEVGAVPAATLAQQTPAEPQFVKQVQQTVTIQATHYMMQEMQKTNELLKTISAKLAFIVDELCGLPQKKE